MDDAAADRLVPRRPGGRSGARPAVLHRPRGTQARQGRAVRRGRRRAVRRLHDLPRADLAARLQLPAAPRPGAASAGCRPGSRRAGAARTCCAAASIGIEERYYGNARIFRPDEMQGLYRALRPVVSYMDVTRRLYEQTTHLDDSTRMQYVDLFTWLRGDILVKADKMTMANSLELRVPFLDTEVFAIGSSIPTDLKITKETTKYALRRALDADRAGARAQPAQARLPGADPALAQGRHVRLGARDHRRVAGRRADRPARRRCACSTPIATARTTTRARSGRCWCS